MKKLTVEIHRSARYIGPETPEFERLKVYRGEFIVFESGILLRYRSKIYQSGLENWMFA